MYPHLMTEDLNSHIFESKHDCKWAVERSLSYKLTRDYAAGLLLQIGAYSERVVLAWISAKPGTDSFQSQPLSGHGQQITLCVVGMK